MGEAPARHLQPHPVPGLPGLPGASAVTTGTREGEGADSGPAEDTGGTVARAPSAIRSSAVMAAGSLISRATGFARSAVIAAALGIGLTADGYAVGNSLPTIAYVLLMGGALNAVFVPELVRAAKTHEDGGAAYTDRLLTACVLALLTITAAAVWAAPAIVDAYTGYTDGQAATTVAFARYCLPQIFFLGVFTLLGQVLNARGRFGAMMWAPVLNNLVVIAVFGGCLALGTGRDGTLTATETALIGWGTTAGIAVQTLALLPALRAARFRWRLRLDWRGSGLGRPLRAAGWLVLLVLANQAAYWVTTRLATAAGLDGGPGFSAYNNAYVLWMVPHGIITVSLVTALMPRMSAAAADADTAALRRDVSYALRTSAAAVVPAACVLFAAAHPVTDLAYGYGRTDAADTAAMAGILTAFAPGLVALSGQYVLSRAFYALGDTRTPFLLSLMVAGLNSGLALTAAQLLPARWAVTGMAAGYSLGLCAGWAVTARVLSRRLGVDRPSRSSAARAHVRLLLAAVPATALGLPAARGVAPAGAPAALAAGVLVVVLTFALLARPLRLTELVTLSSGVRRRVARR
ncbi:murein biosynthesis integral membrane protein MurJ [Streptomyces parvus]|uniref:murein biosynthesis integral membrane protein MurJ n=1 Tax=Streptomyces parvus TaxID=66428 RepID=UPI0036679530